MSQKRPALPPPSFQEIIAKTCYKSEKRRAAVLPWSLTAPTTDLEQAHSPRVAGRREPTEYHAASAALLQRAVAIRAVPQALAPWRR
jgi:hypothetical protein